jgi:radical SAM protein with 4Fe4S-binding SPASM domain
MCRDYNIVPNFTTSGILMNDEKAKICKKYCGAVAVSQHSKLKKIIVWKYKNEMTSFELKEDYNPYVENFDNLDELYLNNKWYLTSEIVNSVYKCFRVLYIEDENNYTYKAIKCLLNKDVKTSIHFVLGKSSIDEAIFRIKNNAFPKGINAVVFLLYKPIGLGRKENMLDMDDLKVKEFFELVDKCKSTFKIGFDSCSCPGLVNFTQNINLNSVDFCEGGRFSAYIDANMNMMPCSFANQDPSWSMSLNEYSIQEIWDSKIFDKFRYPLKNSCKKCPNQKVCAGGCPLVNEITLCNSKNRDFQGG